MLLAPFAAAANVSTFGDGDATDEIELRDGSPISSVASPSPNVDTFGDGDATDEIELRDGSPFVDEGMIHLPASETVTSASVDLSTSMLEHTAHTRIDLETMPRVWNPMYNNQLTKFSNVADFTYEDGSNAVPVELKSEGFLTDFEETSSCFTDH